MRTIDADKLINIFSNLTENGKYTAVFVDQIIKIINEQPTVKSEKCVAEVSISKEQLETVMKPQIDELKQFLSGWIPVINEHWPCALEEGKDYLLSTCYNNVCVDTFCEDIDEDGENVGWFDNTDTEDIVAIMELPEPYKGAE